MKKYCLCSLACAGFFLSLEASAIPLLPLQQAEAERVDFEGKTLHLSGHVKVIHEIGTLYCDESTILLPQEKNDPQQLAVNTILLKGNVVIDFTDESRLMADEGEIDCQLLEGTFVSHQPRKVIYTSFATNDHQKIPVRATGRALKATITKTPTGYTLTSMRGEGAVNIEYLRPVPVATARRATDEEHKEPTKEERSS